jgi:nucleoside 2-deoxyribosyltransferase
VLLREPRRLQIYVAAPLFSEGELAFNLRVTKMLEEHAEVFLPQRDGGKLVDLVSKGVETRAAYRSIYERDVAAIRHADVLFLIMDGRSIDEGAAFELGFAAALKKECVGLQTDPRRLLPLGNNPMIDVPLDVVMRSLDEVGRWVRDAVLRFDGVLLGDKCASAFEPGT